MPPGYNWFLIIVAVIASVLAVAVALYILIAYQHPEDKNQAWVPKIVVVLGISLAIWTVLLFPLDVGNRAACKAGVATHCTLAVPTHELWYACYIAIMVMVVVIIPFSIFYYEADSELSLVRRLLSACKFVVATLVVIALAIGIAYAYAGYVTFKVTSITSGMAPLAMLASNQTSGNSTSLPLDRCVFPGSGPDSPIFAGYLCDAVNGLVVDDTWTLRASFFSYVMALTATTGWMLFMVFAGVGFVSLPMDLIREFVGRPRSTIPRSEYINRAMVLSARALHIKERAAKLKAGGKGFGYGRSVRRLGATIAALEEDMDKLEKVFPQGEDPSYMWVLIVLGYWLRLVLGIVSAILSIAWLLQVVLYIFLSPPLHPFLNTLFKALDGMFPLFGTAAFAIFCFYLIAATINGTCKVGLNLLIFTIHPMKLGATLMSSFLFNVALVLLASTAVIQFCSQAFSLYAYQTAIYEIFSNQLLNLWGLSWLYRQSFFLYGMFGFVGLSVIWFSVKGPEPWRRSREEDAYTA